MNDQGQDVTAAAVQSWLYACMSLQSEQMLHGTASGTWSPSEADGPPSMSGVLPLAPTI